MTRQDSRTLTVDELTDRDVPPLCEEVARLSAELAEARRQLRMHHIADVLTSCTAFTLGATDLFTAEELSALEDLGRRATQWECEWQQRHGLRR